MIKKIVDFFKRLFGKEEQLKIEAPKDNILNQNYTTNFDLPNTNLGNNLQSNNTIKNISVDSNNDFRNNLINNADDRMRLLNMQKAIKAGTLSEKDLSNDDITELKKLYCEQILELSNSIEYYTKQIKSNG